MGGRRGGGDWPPGTPCSARAHPTPGTPTSYFYRAHHPAPPQDSLTSHRAQKIFRSEMGPLTMLQGIQDQPAKARLVCVCVRSLVALMARVPSVKHQLTQTDTQIRQWAPWMLKFCTQFWMKCEKDALDAAEVRAASAGAHASDAAAPAASAGAAAVAVAVAGAGPPRAPPAYLVVYGEEDAQSEDPWVVRAERTLSLLRAALESVGAQPDLLTPEDTWGGGTGGGGGGGGTIASAMEGTVAVGTAGSAANPVHVDDDVPELVSAGAAMGPMPLGVPMDVDGVGLGLKDGMTDEEVEIYLSSLVD